MANVKVFQKQVKGHGQGHMFKMYGAIGKVLSSGINTSNMKAQCLRKKKVMTNVKVFLDHFVSVTLIGQIGINLLHCMKYTRSGCSAAGVCKRRLPLNSDPTCLYSI